MLPRVATFEQILLNQGAFGMGQCLLITVSCRLLAFKWHDDSHM